jgi:hypothetical protein
MNDGRRGPGQTRTARQGADQTQQRHQPYPRYTDPAYSGQSFYPPAHVPGYPANPSDADPTDKLPQYWLHGQPPPDQPPPEPAPGRPKAPRWLWIVATAAVLLVAALVIALVIANGTARKQTAVPALPTMPNPSSTASRAPSPSAPSGPSNTESSPPPDASAMQTVVYDVTGEGRAISITYVDDDGMMQTEFNVGLPWSKQVSLPASSSAKANVAIVNIGHDVSCTVTVDGVEVNQRTGVGLTVCNGAS